MKARKEAVMCISDRSVGLVQHCVYHLPLLLLGLYLLGLQSVFKDVYSGVIY